MESKETVPRARTSGLEPLKHVGAEVGFSLLAVNTLPSDPEHRRMLGAMVTDDVLSFFDSRLSPGDRALWRQKDSGKHWTEADKKRIFGVLDKTIIERAQTLGWLVYRSPSVQARMAQWHNGHEYGPDRFKQLGQAVALAAGVARGQAKLPITEPEWKENKAQAINELRRLFKQYRRVFNQRQSAPSYRECCDWLGQTVKGSPKAFPFLSVNMPSLFQFFEDAQREDSTLRERIALGDINPGQLFHEWGAWGRNLRPDTFRQSISALPSAKV